MKILLKCEQEVSGEAYWCRAVYTLTCSEGGDLREENHYGIAIEEYEEQGDLIVEERIVPAFEMLDEARRFLLDMIREEVLPSTLVDHYDDYFSAFHHET